MRAALPAAALPPLTLPLPILVAAFCLIWSSAFAITRVALADCPPLILVSVRCLIAGAILLVAAAILRTQRFTRRVLAVGALLCVFTTAPYLVLIYSVIHTVLPDY